MKEEQRLMMSEEEVRERAKELLNMPREELITNHLFLQQENESLQSQLKAKEEVIKEASNRINKAIDEIDKLRSLNGDFNGCKNLLEILSKGGQYEKY